MDKEEGPTSKPIGIDVGDMNSLNVRDLYIMKHFLEKGRRSQAFQYGELASIGILQQKIENVITIAQKSQK